jgi:hypothetical protein
MSVTYQAVLDVSDDSVDFLAGLLDAERVRRGTRSGTRALSTPRSRGVGVALVPRRHPDVVAGQGQRHLLLHGV